VIRFGALVAALLIAGCNGAAVDPTPVAAHPDGVASSHRPSVHGQIYVLMLPANYQTWISVYSAASASPIRTIPTAVDGSSFFNQSMLFDRRDNLYYADWVHQTVQVFAPGGSAPAYTIGWGLNSPVALAFDAARNLYVLNNGVFQTGYGAPSVTVYAPGRRVPSRTIRRGLFNPQAFAFDSAGNLYVANCPMCQGYYSGAAAAGNIAVYPPGAVKPSRIITDGIAGPNSIAFDGSDNLYVANQGAYSFNYCNLGAGSSVTVYAPGGASPTRTITNGIDGPCVLLVDAAGTLYVANAKGTEGVSVYAPGQSAPELTITNGIAGRPIGLAFDRTGNLYVLSTELSVYAPGSGTPSRTITSGMNQPGAFAVAP